MGSVVERKAWIQTRTSNQTLHYEPNPDDPLNHEAAELFRRDITQFERLVNRTLKGGALEGTTFQRLV